MLNKKVEELTPLSNGFSGFLGCFMSKFANSYKILTIKNQTGKKYWDLEKHAGKVGKGQFILKCLFGVFSFCKKTKKTS